MSIVALGPLVTVCILSDTVHPLDADTQYNIKIRSSEAFTQETTVNQKLCKNIVFNT